MDSTIQSLTPFKKLSFKVQSLNYTRNTSRKFYLFIILGVKALSVWLMLDLMLQFLSTEECTGNDTSKGSIRALTFCVLCFKFLCVVNLTQTFCFVVAVNEEDETLKIINKFDKNKSTGHNGIGNLIVKGVAKEIVHPLTALFNRSLSTGKVLDSLRIAKVIPIHKKDDKEIFSNYRPVSVLPCFSKILERLIFNRCIEFIENNNILNAKQFGFRAHHSTYVAIMQIVDKIDNAVEKNETTIRVYLDLSKAFDTIDHDILLHKLDYYGFRGIVLNWFRDYLDVSYNDNNLILKLFFAVFLRGQY